MTKNDTMTTATAPKVEPAAPMLKTKAFRWQGGNDGSWGGSFKECFVRMPEGLTPQDIQNHPKMWRNIQESPAMALSRFDRVTCVGADESWMVIGVVTDATRDRVTIHPLHNIKLPARIEQWSDENFSVRWHDGGFAVFRNIDQVWIIGGFQTVGAAVAEVHKNYPKKAG